MQQGSSFSDSFCPSAGIPQGGVISPTLYSFYTSDYPSFGNVNIGMYADDIGLWCSHEIPEIAVQNLQIALDNFDQYCHKWRTNLNADKTEAICLARFKSSRKPINKLRIKNKRVKWSDKVKYLGITINNNFTFNSHYKSALQASNVKLESLKIIFRLPHLSLKSKIILYKSVILSTLCYGCQVFVLNRRIKTFPTYDKFQTKCLRVILGVPYFTTPKYIERICPMTSISDIMQNLTNRYLTKINNTNHPLALDYI